LLLQHCQPLSLLEHHLHVSTCHLLSRVYLPAAEGLLLLTLLLQQKCQPFLLPVRDQHPCTLLLWHWLIFPLGAEHQGVPNAPAHCLLLQLWVWLPWLQGAQHLHAKTAYCLLL
jgi:hypothetical protein